MSLLLICIVILIVVWKILNSSPTDIGNSSSTNIGNVGEMQVVLKLNRLPKEYITLNNVMLPTQYGTTQIDHIVVSPYGIFVIETKNFKGRIFGHESSEEWTQSLSDTKRRWKNQRYPFRNHIFQNLAHFKALKELLKDLGNFTIIPIVVFADRAELNITTPHHIVINLCNLNHIINRYTAPCIRQESISHIISRISAANITDKNIRDKHIHNVQTIQLNQKIDIANRRCPKCGGNLIEHKGQYGYFWGCSNYPRCKFTHKN